MRKYLVKMSSNSDFGKEFYSNSRNSKNHIQQHYGKQGGAWCKIYDASGKIVSSAMCDGEKIYNCAF